MSSCSAPRLTLTTTATLVEMQIVVLPNATSYRVLHLYASAPCSHFSILPVFVSMSDLPALGNHSPLTGPVTHAQPPSSSTATSPNSPARASSDIDDHDIALTWIDRLIDDLKTSTFGFYAATPNLASMAQFFLGGGSGDVAIIKNGTNNDVVELLLSGIFEIDRELFFMNVDGGFPSSNMFNREFVDTKLTCLLIPVQNDIAFSSARDDYDAIIANIKALEKLIPLKKGESVQSCLRESGGKPCIRISHSLFVVCLFSLLHSQLILMLLLLQKKDDDADAETAAEDGKTSSSSHLIACLTILPLEKLTMEWPVHEQVKTALARAALTHNISPLLAYDKDHTPIAPKNYHRKLCGAIVQVHFALIHYFIKQSKKSVFTAVTREIVVLRAPLAAPLNPLKRGRLTNGPIISSSKRERLVSFTFSIAFWYYNVCRTELINAINFEVSATKTNYAFLRLTDAYLLLFPNFDDSFLTIQSCLKFRHNIYLGLTLPTNRLFSPVLLPNLELYNLIVSYLLSCQLAM